MTHELPRNGRDDRENECMSDLLAVFDSDDEESPTQRPLLMTARQRAEIRALFTELGVTAASRQFEVVMQLTGTRITSVVHLEAAAAQRLIAALQRRVADRSRVRTGNSWDDRSEDTWIDRL